MTENVGARTALRIAEYIKPDDGNALNAQKAAEVSELLLNMSLEASVWPNDVPDHIYLATSSPVAQRLAKGNVTQASTVARDSRDTTLLDSMARRDRRRQVRTFLASNPALGADGVQSLWKREREDAPKTGADPLVLACLLDRMEPQRITEAYIEASTMYWNSARSARHEVAKAAVAAVARTGSVDDVINLVVETSSAFPDDTHGRPAWYDPSASEYVVFFLTQHVLRGSLAIDVDDWMQLLALAGPNCVDIAGQAAWSAAMDDLDCTRDPRWAPVAAQAYSHKRFIGYYFGTLSGDTSGDFRPILEILDEDVFARVAQKCGNDLADLILRSMRTPIPRPVMHALVSNPAVKDAARENSSGLIEAARDEDDVRLLSEALGAGSVQRDWYQWSSHLGKTPLSLATQRQLLSVYALTAWMRGVNAPTDMAVYDDIVTQLVGNDTASIAKAVRMVFPQGGATSALFEHAWLTTPGLPQLFVNEPGTSLQEFTSHMLVSRLGGEQSRWDTVLRLLPDWTGSFGELLDVAAAL